MNYFDVLKDLVAYLTQPSNGFDVVLARSNVPVSDKKIVITYNTLDMVVGRGVANRHVEERLLLKIIAKGDTQEGIAGLNEVRKAVSDWVWGIEYPDKVVTVDFSKNINTQSHLGILPSAQMVILIKYNETGKKLYPGNVSSVGIKNLENTELNIKE